MFNKNKQVIIIDKELPKLLTMLVALSALSLPIIISLKIAHQQSLQAESERAEQIARDILKRSELTADQVHRGFTKLASIKVNNPCSKPRLTVMQENDLASSYIQAFGFIADGKLICSSLYGLNNPPLNLGPIDYISSAA